MMQYSSPPVGAVTGLRAAQHEQTQKKNKARKMEDRQEPKPTIRRKMKDHLDNHLKRAFYIGEHTIHRCGLQCRAQPHYHCLYCDDTVTTKIDLTNHLPTCIQEQQKKSLRSLELQLAARRRRRRRQPAKKTPAARDAPTDDKESEEDSDDMDPDRRSRSALPVRGAPDGSALALAAPDKRHQAAQTDLDKPQDCDEFYFLTLVKVFKKLSAWKKSAVRMRIERLLFEAEFQ